ncbi:ROK family protein (putative glucokinase) [Amycolatopsis arida]|uniref:ROK family protein (Putative glucokinase) n=1 Tax=Amycolatopsis arida TaxID=587909 RepID=A0A1I5K8C5_9PSEU|nr:ROK family protein [Amycolatopsis arida]TDX96932.1 glucokinase-like ROK family protein [Amycolatopsis arida]SFO81280.1 ROK family protein (putative glucokinase) [Amycolatopsis arida]
MGGRPDPEVPNAELLVSYTRLLDLVRTGAAETRPALSLRTGLGRTAITQRTSTLLDAGLLEEGDLNPSTGGRQARTLRFRKDAGRILTAELGATGFMAGITDLMGTVLTLRTRDGDIARGPEPVLAEVEATLDELIAETGTMAADIWGVGLGLPGPVEFATGRPSEPPIMPGWNNHPVRDRLAARYSAPVWVDNEVNLLCLGELRTPGLPLGGDLLYIKIGTGIGAGISNNGRLHRGAQGCAGDIGHAAVSDDSTVVCRCGKTGCLEALAGGAALSRDGAELARSGESSALAAVLAERGTVTGEDVTDAARSGDHHAVQLLMRAGRRIGTMLATMVNFYNPSTILLGGKVADAGDLFLAAIRETIYRRSLPLSTRELRIDRARLGEEGGLVGAAFMVLDELFSAHHFARWLPAGSPAGMPELPSTNGHVPVG